MSDRYVSRGTADYAVILADYLPQGRAWPRDPDSTLQKLVAALAESAARVDARGEDLLVRESDPALATELLPDWERVVGLPDPCVDYPLTLPERRQAVVNRLASRGGQSRAYFISVAEQLGYAITIREFSPFMAGVSRCGVSGAEVGPHAIRYYWSVGIPEPRVTWFRAGLGRSGADPHLRIARAEDIECIFTRLKPAHTDILFDYSGE